ncbi:MAG: aldehyde dehydrogenase (acceptor) [Actinomycetia bacterium]|nr:aldehyde dehydrogenase (acceptor) [Actinomycetes bacterium]
MGEVRYRNLVDGEARDATGGGTIDSVDPSTGAVWATIPRGTAADVDAAVSAARAALPGWKALPPLARAALLRRYADVLAARSEDIARAECREMGRPYAELLAGDLPACVQMWHFHAGIIDKLHGDTVDVGPTSFNFTRREPIGVIGVIIPWNSPISLFSAKVAAALAAGNCVVVKPAEQAAGSVLAAAELFAEAGFPPGVVNVISGLGEEAGDALVRHPGVGRITFTGSTETGRLVHAAAAGTLKQVSFELGGKSPNIVFGDADLDAAALGVSTGGVFTGGAGQSCIAGSRILAHESIHDELVDRIVEHARGVVLGDPFGAATMGPIVSDVQFDRVRSYLSIAEKDGATLATGGRTGVEAVGVDSPFAGGYWVEPTLFTGCDNSMRACREEIFGPVACVIPFKDDAEALAIANDSTYGLAAGVWTRDLARAHRFVRDLETGNVWVNAYRRIHWALPFGGVKDSGHGRDSGIESVLENTQLKTAWIDLA